MLAPFVLFFGGLAQLLAGMWVYRARDAVATAMHGVLNAQGAGTIVQFSSIGGRVGGTAGLGSYQAAKFAVDGFTRVLAAETAPLGIRYLIVEAGGFATD